MSLEVTAYESLTKIESDGGSVDPDLTIRLQPADFPERFDGLDQNALYRFGRKYDLEEFSSTWYGWWRNQLARIAGYKPTQVTLQGQTEERYDQTVWNLSSGPFYELIDFSDAEGVIGPKTSAKLYGDFVAFRGKAMSHPDKDFRDTYQDFQEVFRLASNNGAVLFH